MYLLKSCLLLSSGDSYVYTKFFLGKFIHICSCVVSDLIIILTSMCKKIIQLSLHFKVYWRNELEFANLQFGHACFANIDCWRKSEVKLGSCSGNSKKCASCSC